MNFKEKLRTVLENKEPKYVDLSEDQNSELSRALRSILKDTDAVTYWNLLYEDHDEPMRMHDSEDTDIEVSLDSIDYLKLEPNVEYSEYVERRINHEMIGPSGESLEFDVEGNISIIIHSINITDENVHIEYRYEFDMVVRSRSVFQ